MTAPKKAQELAADLRYVLRKHRARIVWREELDGRVTVSAVIENEAEPKALVAGLAQGLSPWWLVLLLPAAVLAVTSVVAIFRL